MKINKNIFFLSIFSLIALTTCISQESDNEQKKYMLMDNLGYLFLNNLPGSYDFRHLVDLPNTALDYATYLVKKDIEISSLKNTEQEIKKKMEKNLFAGTIFSLPLLAISIFFYIKDIKDLNKNLANRGYYTFQKILNDPSIYKTLPSIQFSVEEKEKLDQFNREIGIYYEPFNINEWVEINNLVQLPVEDRETLRYVALEKVAQSYREQKKINTDSVQENLIFLLVASSIPFLTMLLSNFTYRTHLKESIKDKQDMLTKLIEEQKRRSLEVSQ